MRSTRKVFTLDEVDLEISSEDEQKMLAEFESEEFYVPEGASLLTSEVGEDGTFASFIYGDKRVDVLNGFVGFDKKVLTYFDRDSGSTTPTSPLYMHEEFVNG